MSQPKKILMVVTSHDRIDESRRTGLWMEEFAVPFRVFREAGYDVTVASPKGGPTPIDPNSRPTDEQMTGWGGAAEALYNTSRIDSIQNADFDAVFLPGGHGTMFDLPGNAALQRILTEMERSGRIIAAVCHGPAGFVNVKKGDGTPLVESRTLTAFTNEEEREVGLTAQMPFLLQSKLEEEGANFVVRGNWQDHVERDGNLITGQNPQSSGSTARAVVEALGDRRAEAA